MRFPGERGPAAPGRLVAYAVALALALLGMWFVVARPVAPVAQSPGHAASLPAHVGDRSAPPGSRSFAHLGCRAGAPRRLIIPALDVDAAFEPVGLDTHRPVDADGQYPLGTPADRTRAGWYAKGPRPGAGRGVVLTDAHTYRDGSAVFREDFARRVDVDQLIYIETDDGSTCAYQVSHVWREVPAAEYPRVIASENLYSPDGPERLFLATCGGSWNAWAQDYTAISLLVATPVNRW